MKKTADFPLFSDYEFNSKFYDELFDKNQEVRKIYKTLYNLFSNYSVNEFSRLNKQARDSFFNQGITFQVYGEKETKEQIFPFDLFPRIIENNEWTTIEKGVLQRSKALNLFLWDVYHDQKIIKQGIVPEDLIKSSVNFLTSLVTFFKFFLSFLFLSFYNVLII